MERERIRLPGKISYEIRDPEGIWNLVSKNTSSYESSRQSSSGYMPVGPDLGNLGGPPQIKMINGFLSLQIEMKKEGNDAFYKIIDDQLLQAELDIVSPNLIAEGVNVYRVTEEGRERIAYKGGSQHQFFYEPSNTITNADELKAHLELAAKIYVAYATAYYKANNLRIPSDSLIFSPDYFIRADQSHYSSPQPENILKEILISEKPDVRFEDIGGQEKAVEVCRRFAEQLHFPEIFALQGSEPPRGILLSGPQGTGKTMLAKAVANEADADFLHVDAAVVSGEGLYGQSEKAVKAVFNEARKLASAGRHVVIFVDEGDLLLPRDGEGVSRHEATGKTVSLFAEEMDGIISFKGLTVMISTNNPHNIDPKILSRMDESVEVPLPDQKGLEQIFRIHLGKLNMKAHREIAGEEIDLETLSKKGFKQGLSGRDVADIVGLLARERGQKQLDTIRKAIREGQISIPEGMDEDEAIRRVGEHIRNGNVEGADNLVLPKASTSEVEYIVDNAKVLLKNRKKKTGFIALVK